jgi:hypothetical protein
MFGPAPGRATWQPASPAIRRSPSPDLRAIGQDRHEGHGGWNTAQVLQHIDQWIAKSQPDIVLLMIGINDGGTKKSAPLTSGLLGPVRLLISEK